MNANILVPIDFSDASRFALQEADKLAQQHGTLTLLHVHPIVEVSVLEFTYMQPPERMAEVCNAIEKRLEEWRKGVKTPQDNVSIVVRCGAPVAEIIAESEKHGLVVMASHGASGVSHFLLGSVTERVVGGSKCSVLVVKGQRPNGH
jgi:universal stress protein A